MRVDRRRILTGAAASGAALLLPRGALAADLELEPQRGDPRIAVETLTYDPDDVALKVQGGPEGSRAAFEPRIQGFGDVLLATAAKELGVSRATNRPRVEDYLGLFDLPFAMGGKVVPFCAAGLSFVAAAAYVRQKGATVSRPELRNMLGDIDHHHFYPTPSVMDMKFVAMGKHRWVTRAQATGPLAPKPGWLVIYNWDRDGKSDHVGLVDHLAGATLHTIEFNTSDQSASNGGTVARRQRPFGPQIEGFIRPDLIKST